MCSFPVPPPRHTSAHVDCSRKCLPTAEPQRIALWEIEGSLQCSIVGTCLNDQDLRAAIGKHQLQIHRGAQSYDVHSYCVRAASQDCPLARTLHKLLERRYSGALRIIARARTPDEMQAVWERMREGGQIGAGYWAIMSHTHVPSSLKTRAFGEVHMLSHLHGHGASQLATRLTDAQHKCAELEARLRKSEAAKQEALGERDTARAASADATPLVPRAPLGALHAQPPRAPDRGRGLRRLQDKLAKCERGLVVARARARLAEAEAGRLAAVRKSERRAHSELQGIATSSPVPAAPRPAASTPSKHRVLYIGGRAAIVPHLRDAAEARRCGFLSP